MGSDDTWISGMVQDNHPIAKKKCTTTLPISISWVWLCCLMLIYSIPHDMFIKPCLTYLWLECILWLIWRLVHLIGFTVQNLFLIIFLKNLVHMLLFFFFWFYHVKQICLAVQDSTGAFIFSFGSSAPGLWMVKFVLGFVWIHLLKSFWS